MPAHRATLLRAARAEGRAVPAMMIYDIPRLQNPDPAAGEPWPTRHDRRSGGQATAHRGRSRTGPARAGPSDIGTSGTGTNGTGTNDIEEAF
jgi:hypothetical protein